MIALSLFFVMGLANPASAQNININVNINLDKQPSWGPSGYDYAEFYYMPDLNIYYDVINSLFYYYSGGAWTSNQYLPYGYRKYDFYNMYKVVINERQPWLNNKTHKKSYSHYKGDKTQEPIRFSNNTKYNTSKDNNRRWVEPGGNTSNNQNKGSQPNNNSSNNKNQNTQNNNQNKQQPNNNNNGGNNKR